MRFFIMDVFTSEKYSGNQLAVVFAAPNLETGAMQRIAREFNFSETTFIIGDHGPDTPVRVRIFTPNRELPFAGHATLGTALVLRNEFRARHGEPPERITLDLDIGPIPVDFQDDPSMNGIRGYMRQKPGIFGRSLDAKSLANVVGLRADDFVDAPALEVSTGVVFLMARLGTLAAVQRARLNHGAFAEVFGGLEANGLHIHSLQAQNRENQVHCRMFAPSVGVDEDPATGSAAGCLAEYIRRVDGRNEAFELRVEQGYEMNRPSLLLTGFDGESPGPRVGGHAVESARGELV